MIGCTCTIHLGIQWPKIQKFQIVYSTPTWNAPELMPNISKLYFHVFQSFMLNKNVLLLCSGSFLSTQNISSIMCFKVHAQHKTFRQSCALGSIPNTTNIYIHISSIIGLRPLDKTNHHVHMQWGL